MNTQNQSTETNDIKHMTSRRGFLRRATTAVGAALAAPLILPARVFGADGTVAPSNRINVGLIGTGRQVFYANLPWFLWSDEAQVVAVCDVDSWRLEKAKAKVEDHYSVTMATGVYKGCAAYRDFRDLLARKDIDAVMISTPDHWHAYIAIEAAKAGKDVALEKPIALSIAEGRAIVNAMKKHNRVFRMDTEVRTQEKFLRIVHLARNGRLGQIKRVVVGVPGEEYPLQPPDNFPRPMPVPPELDYKLWQGPAPKRPYTEKRVHPRKAGLAYDGHLPGWMQIRDYSLGIILNWGTHTLDIAQWALNTDHTGPVEVEGQGEYPKANLWDVMQRFRGQFRYANGVELLYANHGPEIQTSRIENKGWRGGRPFVRIEGTEGWIEHTYYTDDFVASDPALLKWKPGPNDLQFPLISEKQDFINCIKSRKETMIPAEVGHRTATICHLAQIAIDTGAKLKWNPDTEQFLGNDHANQLLDRPHRAPWKIEGCI